MTIPTLHFNAILDRHDDTARLVVRYLQVGYRDPDGDSFTGWVRDYCGGGEYDDVYYVAGERIDDEVLGDDWDGDDAQDHVDGERPGLSAAVWARVEELVVFGAGDDQRYYAGPRLVELLGDDEPEIDRIVSETHLLEPIDGFNTGF